MILALALTLGILMTSGVYLILSRDAFRCVLGISIVGAAVNLFVLASGRLGPSSPPIIPAGESRLESAASALPQALVLTAIVIGFAMVCFLLVLVVRLSQMTGTVDTDSLRLAEPPPAKSPYPPFLGEESMGSK